MKLYWFRAKTNSEGSNSTLKGLICADNQAKAEEKFLALAENDYPYEEIVKFCCIEELSADDGFGIIGNADTHYRSALSFS